MILWRSCNASLSRSFDGTGGMLSAGRWHSRGQAITYSASAPSLTVLERLVHVEDPDLLPALAIVAYAAPDDLEIEEVTLASLPADWRDNTVHTRKLGDAWIASRRTALLRVPSAIMPLADIPDRNVVINHEHADTRHIRIVRVHEPFALGGRLLRRADPTP